jgi:hypothetical protein
MVFRGRAVMQYVSSDQNIVSDPFVADAPEAARIVHPIDSDTAETRLVSARQAGSDEAAELVDQLLVPQLTQDISASFHEETCHTSGAEFPEQMAPIGLPIDNGSVTMLIRQEHRIGRQISGPCDDNTQRLYRAKPRPHS